MKELELVIDRFGGEGASQTVTVEGKVNVDSSDVKSLASSMDAVGDKVDQVSYAIAALNKGVEALANKQKALEPAIKMVNALNLKGSVTQPIQELESIISSGSITNFMTTGMQEMSKSLATITNGSNGIPKWKSQMEELSTLDLGRINQSSLTRTKNQLQEMLNMISKVQQNGSKGQLAGLFAGFQATGLINTLPSTTQATLEAFGKLDAMAKEDGQSLDTLKHILEQSVSTIDNVSNSVKVLGEEEEKEGNEVEKNNNKHETQDKVLGNLSTKYTELLSKVRLYTGAIRRVTSFIGQMVAASGDMIESINLYRMALGDLASEGIGEWEDITSKLYLDPKEVYQYSGQFYNLAKGLGVAAEDAAFMAKNLTQLTFDMTSYVNLSSNEKAFDKLQSAMSGQTKAVTNMGIAVQSASLQELAYSMGIEKSVQEMTQAEKTYLRYIQIMKSTTQMQGDLGKTIITPTNAMRLFTTQVTLLTRAIGQVLTPVIMKILPYLIALTQLLTEAAKGLAALMGFDLQDFEAPASKVSSLFKDISDDAKDTAGTINRTLAKFDDLNVVENTGGGSGSGLEDTIDFSKYLEGYDMLKDYTDKIQNQIEETKKKIMDMLPYIASAAALFLSWKIASGFMNSIILIGNFLKAWERIKSLPLFVKIGEALGKLTILKQFPAAISNIGAGIGEWLSGATTFGEMIKGIAGSLGVVAATIGGIIAVVKGIFDVVGGIKDIIKGDTFKGILKTLRGIAEIVGGIALLMGGWVVAAVAAVVAITTTIIMHWEEIKTFFVNLWNGFIEIMSSFGEWLYGNVIEPVGSFFVGLFEGIVGGVVATWDFVTGIAIGIASWLYENVIEPIYKKFEPIITWFAKLFTSVFNTLSDIVYDIVGLIAGAWEMICLILGVVGDFIYKTVIKPVGEFFAGLWNFIKNGAIAVWEGIKIVFGAISSWVYDYIIKPVITVVGTMWDNFVTRARDSWEAIKFVFSRLAKFFGDIFSDAWDKVKKVFSVGGMIFKGIKEGITSVFTTVVNSIIKGINTVVATPFNAINTALKKIRDIEIAGVKPFENKIKLINVPQIPLLDVKQYAKGGYPDSGDLFFANENGRAEYITSVGNKTAVANQDQMTTALADTITRAIGSLNNNNERGDVVVYIGNDKVYQGQGEYQSRQSDRYGTTYVKV